MTTSMARTGQTRSVAKMTSVQLRQQLETVKSAITVRSLFNPNNIFFNTNLLSILYSSLDQHTILCTDSHLKIYTVQTPQNVENMHRSNAEHLIDAMPIIDVHGGVAVCDGGGGALGHPIEYIQLNMVEEGVENECKYCGLRFRSVGGHH